MREEVFVARCCKVAEIFLILTDGNDYNLFRFVEEAGFDTFDEFWVFGVDGWEDYGAVLRGPGWVRGDWGGFVEPEGDYVDYETEVAEDEDEAEPE